MTLVAQGQKSYSRNSVWNKAYHLSNSSLHKKHEKVLPSIKNYTYFLTPPSHGTGMSLFLLFFSTFLQRSPHPPAARAFCKGCTRESKAPTRGWGTLIFLTSKKKAESQILLTSESSKAAQQSWCDPSAWGRGEVAANRRLSSPLITRNLLRGSTLQRLRG